MATKAKTKPPKAAEATDHKALQSYVLQFGLIPIPVGLVGVATEMESKMTRNMTHKGCGNKLKQGAYTCDAHGTEATPVKKDDIIKAHHYKGGYVEITDEEMQALPVASKEAIRITRLVPVDQIDPALFQKSYFLNPKTGGGPGFRLLYHLLRSTERVAVAEIAVRGPQDQLCVVRAERGRLWLHTMFWAQEMKIDATAPQEVEAPESQFLQMGEMLAQQFFGDFNHAEYQPKYAKAWEELVEKKLADPTYKAPAATPKAETGTLDLMAALQASLQQAQKAPQEKTPQVA